MARPAQLEVASIEAWLRSHGGWELVGKGAIARRYTFPDFATALAFAVRVGCWAEKHDHHPDLELGWGKARVLWSTHDAGGITELDLAGAEASDQASG